MSEIEQLAAEVRTLTAEVRSLREIVAPALPPELTVAQAMTVTNHRSAQAFYDWCKRRRVRPIAHGRYSLRRLRDALAA